MTGQYIDKDLSLNIRNILKGMPEGQDYHYQKIAEHTNTSKSLVIAVVYRRRKVTKVSKPIVFYARRYTKRMAKRQLNLIK